MKNKLRKKLRILLVWTIAALLLQFAGYSFFNAQVQKVLSPAASGPVTVQLKATIPGIKLENLQISYAKDYLAYTENGTLKVFNLTKGKVVFEKTAPAADKKSGVIMYQWLPDRNTLLYFYARKNPNVSGTVVFSPSKTSRSNSIRLLTYTNNTPGVTDTEDPRQEPPKDSSRDSSKDSSPGTSKDTSKDNSQDSPKDSTKNNSKNTREVPAAPQKNYVNPQITEIYSVKFPNSKEETAPEEQLKETVTNFPAGGEIEKLVFSTPTNLLYFTLKNEAATLLREIDVMGYTTALNKAGETIDNMVASDQNAALYINSKIGKTRQVLALDKTKRHVISEKNSDRILGVRAGTVYIGEVEDNKLVGIKTTADLAKLENNPSLKKEWEGSIPFDSETQVFIGFKGQIIIYTDPTAYIVASGKLTEARFQGEENYLSLDGAEVIQLTRKGDSTLAELEPVEGWKGGSQGL